MDASRRVNSPLVIQFKPMTEALHLQSGLEDCPTKLQMTAGVEIYVRVFRLPLFCLIFTGIASGLLLLIFYLHSSSDRSVCIALQ